MWMSGCVKSFCYLGDTLDGADLAATARIRNGWMKFRELLPFLTSRDDPGMSLNCAPTRGCRKSASRPGYVVKGRTDPGYVVKQCPRIVMNKIFDWH